VVSPRDWQPGWSETLGRIAAGERHKHIAATLGIGPKSFNQRLTRIRRRLGARNTVHAVAIAAGRGLLTPYDGDRVQAGEGATG
jgi:DNA-binding CsgD family transcriptional regulator